MNGRTSLPKLAVVLLMGACAEEVPRVGGGHGVPAVCSCAPPPSNVERERFVADGETAAWFLAGRPDPRTLHVFVIEDGIRYDFDDDDYGYDLVANGFAFYRYVPSAGNEVYAEYEPLD